MLKFLATFLKKEQTYKMILIIFIHSQKLGNFLLTKRSANRFILGGITLSKNYNMNGQILEDVTMQQDLGILVDRELKCHNQTAAAVKKANQVLGIIKKTIYTKSKITISLLYMSLVRPHLEYANPVWGPHYKITISYCICHW